MQLGDMCSVLGYLDKAISCNQSGLRIQVSVLGESELRVAESYRYLAEAYVQTLQLDEAERLCKKIIQIYGRHEAPTSLEEAASRKLMALRTRASRPCQRVNGSCWSDDEVAAVDVDIGNVYSSLCRFDEAVFSYQKALAVFKSTKGENQPLVVSVFVCMADLFHKTGKLRESKSYCENALRIYSRPLLGTTVEEIASGLTGISAIYEALDEPEEALNLLDKATKLFEYTTGQHHKVAGIKAQIGVTGDVLQDWKICGGSQLI